MAAVLYLKALSKCSKCSVCDACPGEGLMWVESHGKLIIFAGVSSPSLCPQLAMADGNHGIRMPV